MGSTIQARLDKPSTKLLRQLSGKLGWSPSRLVREGLRLLAIYHLNSGDRRVIGIGQFASHKPDLGSNKAHLKEFGR